jgi:hypothetical protein
MALVMPKEAKNRAIVTAFSAIAACALFFGACVMLAA